nr:hypothetical protein [uncultured Selenomonas sp.]
MLSAAIIAKTFAPCSRKSEKPRFQCLDLADGQTQGWSELRPATSHGGSWTLNIGECPRDASASSLSQILQKREDVPEKYFLSPRACKGILRRAKERGKELPPELKAALLHQASPRGTCSPTASTERTERQRRSTEEPGREHTTEPCTSAGFTYKASANARTIGYEEEVAPTIATDGKHGVLQCGLDDQGGGRMETYTDTAPTLRAQAHNHPPVVHDATVYVSGGFASFDEKPVAGSVRAAGGDRGGAARIL